MTGSPGWGPSSRGYCGTFHIHTVGEKPKRVKNSPDRGNCKSHGVETEGLVLMSRGSIWLDKCVGKLGDTVNHHTWIRYVNLTHGDDEKLSKGFKELNPIQKWQLHNRTENGEMQGQADLGASVRETMCWFQNEKSLRTGLYPWRWKHR